MDINNQLKLWAPFLHVEESKISISAIDAGASTQVTFLAHADDNAVDGIINYGLQAESGYHTVQKDSQIQLGYLTEDFEGESLNEDLRWNIGSGNKKWTVVEDSTALGCHCFRSPVIPDRATANLYIGIDTDVANLFSFYHKTSTEEGDMLILYINGREVETWSGISDWERSEYELREGSNIIRLSFKKDAEGSAGEDAVMIDELHFPPFAKMVLYAGDDTEMCSQATFNPQGYIYNHTDFTWTTNGDGTFDDATLEQPTYTFGETDMAEGYVELTLTGTSALNGSQQSSTVAVSLIPSYDASYMPETPSGATEIDLRLVNESDYLGEEIPEVIYTWSLAPETAGILTSEGHQAHVVWDSEFRGEATISYRYENTCGSTEVSEALAVNVFNSTGLDEQGVALIEVYPNPTDGKVNLVIGETLQGKAVVEVYNMLSEKMLTKSINDLQKGGTYTLDLHHLVSGLYIIKLSSGNGSCTKKVSVK